MHDLIGTIVWAAAAVFTVVSVKNAVVHHLSQREIEWSVLKRLDAIEAELERHGGAVSVQKRVTELEKKMLAMKAGRAMGKSVGGAR